jgi:hypothetical protein
MRAIKYLLLSILFPGLLLAQTKIDYNTQITNKPPANFVYLGVSAGKPAGCSTGNLAYITDVPAGQNIYVCNSGTWTGASGGSGAAISVNGVLNAVQNQVNFLNSSSFNGLTNTFTYVAGGGVQLGFTGSLGVGGGGTGAITLSGPLKGNGTSAIGSAVAADIYGLWTGCSNTTFLRGDGTCQVPIGTGSVSSFASGNLSPLFTTSVATPTTTPVQSFTLSTAPAHTYFGNNNGVTATPNFSTIVLGDLPSTVVASTVNDSNVTGSISGQALTFGWLGLLPASRGGTNNGFFQVSGPASVARTFTFPNASATVLTDSALVTVAQGGSGASTLTGPIKGNGTSAFTIATSTDIIALWTTGVCSSSTFLRGDGQCQTPSGAGTVTSFSAGTLSPIFTTSVATATSTPALSFSLSTAAAHSYLGNNTGSTTSPSYSSLVAADLPATTVNAVTNDTNVTGSIAGQILTLGWTSVLAAARGGTGSANFQVAGPTALRTYTFPDASATVLTTNAAVTVGQGGTGVVSISGLIRGNGVSPFTPATAADVISLWTPTCDNTTFLRGDGSCQAAGSGGLGTVTNFTAGNLTPLFTTGVTNPSTTPNLTFTLSTASANTVFGNCTGSTAAPSFCSLVAGQLPTTTVNSVVNDTNVTGSIAARALTLGWTGVLAAGRLNSNVVQSFVNDTNVTASISAQAATLGWTGTLAVSRGGIGVGTITGPIKGNGTSAVTSAVAADIYGLWSGTCSSTTFLRGDGSCAAPAGTGTVTSVSSGSAAPLFTTAVATSSTTPAISYTISAAAAHTYFGNNTGVSTSPAYVGIVSADLPATTVNSVTNDANITGSIATQTLTLAWSGLLSGLRGGTNNGFFQVSGPVTSVKTFTFPNANANVLTDNALITVAQGGTGVGTVTGPIKGNGVNPFTAAVSADIIGLWSGSCNNTSFLRGDGTCSATTGTGTVTSFSSGNLSPVFTTSVATATTTPALTFNLSTASAHTYLGNNTGVIAAPAYSSIVAADLPSTIPSSITNDVNVTGSISSQILTLGWTGILSAARGGTASAFFQVTGPSVARTFTFPDANATVLTSANLVTAAQGGTGVGTITGPIRGNGTGAFTAATSADLIALWTGTCNSTTFLRGDGSCQTTSGTGSVTSFSSGNLAPLFTTSVTTPTSTPALSFALSNASAHTYFGNNTGGTGVPGFATIVAGDLPTTTVNSVVNDTNVTGSISAQALTLGWTGLLSAARGGTNNGFFQISGPASSTKTFTLPNASANILTDAAAVTAPQGGTGLSSPTAHSLLVTEGASNFNLVTSPSTNGQYVCMFNVTGSAALDPTCALQGISIDAQTGASYIVPTTDNVTLITASNSGAQAYTGPALASNIVFSLFNINTGVVTYIPASGTVNGNATQKIPGGWFGTAYTDNSNTIMPVLPTNSAFPNCTDSAGNHLNFTASTGVLSCGTTSSAGGAYPLTVSGVTSGGVPYFSSTTVQASSGILNTNILVKGGGAGGAPTNSSVTDNGTTVTSSDTGGFAGTGFSGSSGGAAGFVTLKQGSANGHGTANFATLESPAAVTAYEWLLPASAATGIPLLTNSSSVMTQSFLTSTANGDILTGTGTTWSIFAGNASGTKFLTEDASGNMIWASGTGALLSGLSAAGASNTLANGNNPQIWNWAQTSNTQAAMTFGETSAATNGTISGLLANQSEVAVSTATASTATPLSISQGSITGTVAFPALQIASTWNNAGLTAQGIVVSATVTAAAANSLLLNLQAGASGTTSEFSVNQSGSVIAAGPYAGTGYKGTAANSVIYQGGADTATAGSGGGQGTFRGGDNTSTTASSAGGVTLLRGGDESGSTANTLFGGNVTIRGGNVTAGTGTSSTGGNVSISAGDCVGVASATSCPGTVIIDQPYFTTGTIANNDLACVTATNTVASCSGTTTGTFIGVVDSNTTNTAFISSLAAGGVHTFNATSATFTNGDFVCQDPTSANKVVDSSTVCGNGLSVGVYIGSTGTQTAPKVLMMPGQGGISTATQIAIARVGSAGLSGTAPVAIASTGVISLSGASGQIPNGATGAFTATPSLGTDNSVAGTLTLANGSAAAHTILSSGATTTNTIQGFATVPTTGRLLDCTVTLTTCLLHDSGVVTANVVNASSPGAGIAHFAGSTQTVTSSLIVAADITSGTITGTQIASAVALAGSPTTTTQSADDNSTKIATTAYVDRTVVRALGWSYGDVATGSALTTSEVGYITVPYACTITGWHIMADAGTVTIKTARVNGGTALPTVGSNSISTSGVSLSSGTKIDSTTVTDFTSTAISANDTLGFFITAVATAKQITFQIDCKQ